MPNLPATPGLWEISRAYPMMWVLHCGGPGAMRPDHTAVQFSVVSRVSRTTDRPSGLTFASMPPNACQLRMSTAGMGGGVVGDIGGVVDAVGAVDEISGVVDGRVVSQIAEPPTTAVTAPMAVGTIQRRDRRAAGAGGDMGGDADGAGGRSMNGRAGGGGDQSDPQFECDGRRVGGCCGCIGIGIGARLVGGCARTVGPWPRSGSAMAPRAARAN